MENASKVAEMMSDKVVLRKKVKYVNFEDESEVVGFIFYTICKLHSIVPIHSK